MSTETTDLRGYLTATRDAVNAAGLPAAIGVKPETSDGQPWALLSVLSTVFDGDISAYNTDHETLVLVRAVGFSAEQAQMAYWRADGAVVNVDTFPGGVVTFRTRETLSGPLRDDATFPDRSVYYVDATYRLWLAPTEEN